MKIPLPVSRRKARIEIIPLIDIIFFLLATFVMISLSMVKNQGLNVNLPTARSSVPQDRKDSLIITITEGNDVYVDKQKISFDGLPQYLNQLKASQPDLKVFINADKNVSFDQAVKVLDEVRVSGISKVAIQTKNPSTAGQ